MHEGCSVVCMKGVHYTVGGAWCYIFIFIYIPLPRTQTTMCVCRGGGGGQCQACTKMAELGYRQQLHNIKTQHIQKANKKGYSIKTPPFHRPHPQPDFLDSTLSRSTVFCSSSCSIRQSLISKILEERGVIK